MSRPARSAAAVVVLGAVGSLLPGAPTGAAAASAPTVQPAGSPAFAQDAPDPDVIRVGTTYYGYTTGTTWGNYIGVLTSTAPSSGWRTADGQTYGSTAMGPLPSWEKVNTQTSPGVFAWAGRYVMFYDAFDPSVGHWCLSVATASSPTGPFDDNSAAPFECQADGSVDPSPFVDASGQPWLYWKENDGSASTPAYIWAAPLAPTGTALASSPTQVLTQDTVNHPWETTVENPDMVLAAGSYYLFFSSGRWDSSGYAEGYAVCDGPAGPCTQPQPGPLLASYGQVAGPGRPPCSPTRPAPRGWPTRRGPRRAPPTRAGGSAGCTWRPSPSAGRRAPHRHDRPATASPPPTEGCSTSATCPTAVRRPGRPGRRWSAWPPPPTRAVTGWPPPRGGWRPSATPPLRATPPAWPWPPRWSAWPPPPTGPVTGWPRPTEGSSPSATPPGTGRWAAPGWRPRWSGWRPTARPVATGWSPRTEGCSPSTPPSAARPGPSASTGPWSAWPPPATAAATGWWRPTAASSPTGTPPSSARPGPSASTGRWSEWPPPATAPATGWWPPTAGCSVTATPPSTGRPGR